MAASGPGTGKRTEEQRRDLPSEAELFINAVPSILIGLDSEGRIKRWNDAAAQTFGLTATEVLGKPLASCGIEWLTPGIDSMIDGLLHSESRRSWEGTQFEKDGEPRLLGMTVNWIRPADGARSELLIVGSDITEKRKAQDELRSKTAFLEALIQAAIDGVLVVDELGNVVWRNQRFLDLFDIPESLWNVPSDDLLLRNVLGKIENPQAFLEEVTRLYIHKHDTTRDEIKRSNGMVLDRYSSPVFGRDGNYYGRIWTFRDITERKQAEDALRQLSVAVEQSPVIVVITDLKGNITYVNRRFTECTGYTPEEVMGQNPRLLKSGHTPPEEYRHLWGTITRGEEWRGELRNRKKNGDLYWESVVISPIRNAAGETSHFLAVKEDITEQKLAESHARQAQKMKAIGQLAAGIAHEINTPIQFVGDNVRFIKEAWQSLDSLISLCQSVESQSIPADFSGRVRRLLEDCDAGYLRSEIPGALDQSLDGIGRVAKIVHAMKEFSHPGSDEKQPADVNELILTTLTVSRNEWKYVAEVETFLQKDLLMVPCHPGELNQVLLNLLVNAAHAIAEVVGDGSAAKGKITVRTIQDGQFTTISIQDTGAGIRPEIQSRIFDPFFTTKAVGRGTGQGLSLAHNSIVKKHGGKIWFESAVGTGTTFYIQLPMTGGPHTRGETHSVCG
jgi:two-component system, NtrC family, sensor kinase